MIEAPTPHQLVSTIVNDLVEMETTEHLQAIAVVVVKENGDLRTLMAYNKGAKLPLLAGCSILHSEMTGEMQRVRDGSDA